MDVAQGPVQRVKGKRRTRSHWGQAALGVVQLLVLWTTPGSSLVIWFWTSTVFRSRRTRSVGGAISGLEFSPLTLVAELPSSRQEERGKLDFCELQA